MAAADLKDPDSAKFRNLERFGDLVCGEVNAKNAFGGFVGYSPFYIKDGAARVALPTGDDLSDAVEHARVTNVCSSARIEKLNGKMTGGAEHSR